MAQIYGHRGAFAYAPENTLESFDLAVQMGVHGVELDVHICRSGELVVIHDEHVERVTQGYGLVKDHTLSELKKLRINSPDPKYSEATVPTLQEVFQLLKPTGLRINVELKNGLIDYPDLERKTVELAAKEGMLDRVFFSSFNHHSMLRMKAIDPNFYCGLLYEATLVKSHAYAVALGMDALHPHFSELLVPGTVCREAHAVGLQVNPWTVNREEDIRACLRAGADIIISNYPDRALRLLHEFEAETK